MKNLKPGNCIAFGNAFKVPISMYIDIPNPRPMSNNVDINNVWYSENTTNNFGVAEITSSVPVNNNKFINVSTGNNLSEEL